MSAGRWARRGVDRRRRSWHPASGRGNWQYNWSPSATGVITILARAADDSGNLGAAASVKVDVGGRKCPCTLFDGAFAGSPATDGQPIEVGTRFTPDTNGWAQALWYYDTRASGGPGPVGHLWRGDGTRLAEVQFAASSGPGWKRVALAAHVPLTAGAEYVTSYAPADDFYAGSSNYFTAPFNAPPLHAPLNAGVYRYGGGFPVNVFGSSNYWADVEFDRPVQQDPPPGSGSPSTGGGSGGGNGPVAQPASRPVARARIKPRRIRASRRGAVRLRVLCAGGESGCKVRLRMKLGSRQLASRKLTINAGGAPRTVSIRLKSADRRRLARKGSLRLTVVASVQASDGRRTVTRTRIVVLAPKQTDL